MKQVAERKNSADFIALEESYGAHNYHPLDVVIARAEGAWVWDVEGKKYMDFLAAYSAVNQGHCHPRLIKVLEEQASRVTLTSRAFRNDQLGPFCEELTALTGFDRVLPMNTGAEAVETALKAARKWGYTVKGIPEGEAEILVFAGNFHGRTTTIVGFSSDEEYKFGFGPTATEVYRMPFGDTAGADKLKDFLVTHVNPESVAAVVAEPVQGEGGFIAPPPGYFQELIKICQDNGILFIADEIQSGMGRTGKMFAIEHWGVEPDLITVAKSLAAGMPLAAVVGKAEIMDAVHPWGLGGTYGGNPVACAAALAVLKVFEEENMLEKSVALGRKLKSRFEQWQNKFDILGEIRGLGAMLGIELVKGPAKTPAAQETGKLVKYCNDNGLVVLGCGTYGNIIRVLAPFVITDAQLEKGLSIMEEGLTAISK